MGGGVGSNGGWVVSNGGIDSVATGTLVCSEAIEVVVSSVVIG